MDVIVGNPPFLGGNKMRTELGDEYVDDLFQLYDGRVPAFADLVCYWFEKARAQIAAGKAKRVGLLATQLDPRRCESRSVGADQGNRRYLLGAVGSAWVLDGAAVHVSMVGFDDGSETTRELDSRPVQRSMRI